MYVNDAVINIINYDKNMKMYISINIFQKLFKIIQISFK